MPELDPDSGHIVQVEYVEYIDAEAAFTTTDPPIPASVVSFGGHEGPVVSYMLTLPDCRELVTDLLNVLAAHGDEIAQKILNENFNPSGGPSNETG